jgi:hypothetical protein
MRIKNWTGSSVTKEILKEYPMEKHKDTIFYLKPVYSKTNIFRKIKNFLIKLFRR